MGGLQGPRRRPLVDRVFTVEFNGSSRAPNLATSPCSSPPGSNLSSTVRPEKADVFSGSQPRRGKSQSPVTRVAGWRETKTLKPTDQAIERMVSESPGRNASERIGGPEILKPWRPSLTVERRRQHGPSHLADAAGHSGGGIATARGPGHGERLEKPSSPHRESGGGTSNL